MTIRAKIKNLVDNKEAAIFGVLYSVKGEAALARLEDALSKADIDFKEKIINWVELAEKAIAKGGFPSKNVFIKSEGYAKELEPSSPKELINIMDTELKLCSIRSDLAFNVNAGSPWLNHGSDNKANIEKMKFILFMDAVLPVLDLALLEIFSENNDGLYVEQLRAALDASDESIERLQYKASKIQMQMLFDLVRTISFKEYKAFSGHAAEFFKKYQEFCDKMDEFFSWMEGKDCIPVNVGCEAFNWRNSSSICKAELENCMILQMY